MNACGLIVEYNPFHNGHYYHIQEAKKVSKADCIIAVMSGNFLQRGEPAIMDKFHRTKAALASGADIVLELPYAFAVQNSDWFAKGSVQTLNAIGVSSICFGSESGEIAHFIDSYYHFQKKQATYQEVLKKWLDSGSSFPEASQHAYEEIGLTSAHFDLSQPNNILGLSYVKTILDNQLQIQPLTIKRFNNHFHESEITNPIASATSIRNEVFSQKQILTPKIEATLPSSTIEQLHAYKEKAATLHNWENYFQVLNYRVQTMSALELQKIKGVDEGLENRVKRTAKTAKDINSWIEAIKTKRYTWTRLQRMFVHILTNTKKEDFEPFFDQPQTVPYVRLLGMTKQGQHYLNAHKKDLEVPIISGMKRKMHPMLQMEEKATNAYYSILTPNARKELSRQEIEAPILFD